MSTIPFCEPAEKARRDAVIDRSDPAQSGPTC